jgi:hypothetical protein
VKEGKRFKGFRAAASGNPSEISATCQFSYF